jgi:hypothetical protein
MEIQIATMINKIEVQGDINLTFRYDIGAEFNNFLNFYIPTIETTFESSDIAMTFKLGFFSFDISINKFPEDPWNKFREDEPVQSSVSNPKTSNTNNDEVLNIFEIISNIGDGTGHCGVVFIATAFIGHGYRLDESGLTAFSIGVIIGIFEFVSFIIATFFLDTDITRRHAALLGLGIGYLISGFAALITAVAMFCIEMSVFTLPDKVKQLETILTGIDFIFTFFGIEISIVELLQSAPDDEIAWMAVESVSSISGGLFGLILGSIALLTIQPPKKSANISLGLAQFFILLGFIIISWALSDAT